MKSWRHDITSYLGGHVLPFNNPRVVCPPGWPETRGRLNIVVATPKRCGTHVLIDIILNNISAYRNKPLYIDLDKVWRRSRHNPALLDRIDLKAGYVIKTHLPILEPGMSDHKHILELLDSAMVLTVHRDVDAMVRSTLRWAKGNEQGVPNRVRAEYETFWSFWENRPRIALEFEDLFNAERMQSVLADLCVKTSSRPTPHYRAPTSADRSKTIQLNKAMTRLTGRHALRIDTTIHTLK